MKLGVPLRAAVLFGAAVLAALPVAAGEFADGTFRAETYRDALGFELPPGPRPERIISLSPNLTEILFAIGVERDRVVGVTRFCDYPPEVEGIRKIGGIVDPSVEVIVSLRPDLVLATRGNPTVVIERLRAAGIPMFAFESQGGLDPLIETMETMARVLCVDRAARADSVIRALRLRLDCLRAISATVPDSSRPTVYYYDPVSPDWTTGPGTHASEAIALAGGRNVADDAPVAWPRMALETLLVRQPDVILLVADDSSHEGGGAIGALPGLLDRTGMRGMQAVRDTAICVVPADWLMRPGPRVLDAVEVLGRCLHPKQDWQCAR